MRIHFHIAIVVLLVLTLPSYSQTQPTLKIQGAGVLRHPSVVQAIVITPNSQKAFIALNDGTLLAYSLESLKPIDTGFRVYSTIYGLALNARGDRLAITDADGYVRMLDTDTFKTVKIVRLAQTPERIVFAANSESLFVGLSNGHLVKLNASDLTTVKDIFPTTGSRVLGLACSGDGRVATSDRDGKIKLWSGTALDSLGEWKAHDGYARSLAFDPSGQHLVSGGGDGVLKAWKLSDKSLVKESKDLHRLSIDAITFGPDGRMVTGGYDGLCQFWDGKKFEGLKSYPNYRGYFTACAISADGRWLVRGGSSLDFVPMDDPEEYERVAEFGGAIMGLAVAPGRKRFATGGLDRRLICWEIDKGITAKTALLDDWVTAVEFCDEGKAIAAGLIDGRIAIYSAPTMQLLKSWPAHDGRINALASVAGKLVSVGDDGMVRLWSLAGARVRSYDEKSPCRSLTARDTRFAVGTAEGTMSVYDLAMEAPVKRLQGRPLSVTALAFSPGGTRLMAGYFDGGIESIYTESWTVAQFHAGKGDRVLSIEGSAAQELVVVGYGDGYARLYDTASLRETGSIQPSPAREIFAARWLLDDNTFALAGASNGISFWKLKTGVQEVRALNLGANGARADAELTKDVQSISYEVKFVQGKTYVIDMIAPAGSPIDPFLRLLNPSGKEVAYDDDSGGGLNARITYAANATATYRIIATSFGSSVGRYTLMVKEK